MKHEHLPLAWIGTLVRPKQRKRDVRFCTRDVRSLIRADSLTAAARELGRYKLDLVGAQEVRCVKVGTVRKGDYNFFMEKDTKIINLEQDFFVHHRLERQLRG